ncbi:MAG: HypC/HybG/HupF family hydrogenase formation chaperone [Frankiales bacterium]|nr:HypC/HybG/HupF family hydrogenase formation chaperone [Frankiales bacterium]
MCLGLPGQVVSVVAGSHIGRVEVAGVVRDIDLSLLAGPVLPGEYVLVHSGMALERMSVERAGEAAGAFRATARSDAPE